MFFLKKKPKSPRPAPPPSLPPCIHEYHITDVNIKSHGYDDWIEIYDVVCIKCKKHKKLDEMDLLMMTQHFNVKDGKGNLL